MKWDKKEIISHAIAAAAILIVVIFVISIIATDDEKAAKEEKPNPGFIKRVRADEQDTIEKEFNRRHGALEAEKEAFIKKCYEKKDWTAEDLEEFDKEYRSLNKKYKDIMLWVDKQMEELLEKREELRKGIEKSEK